MQTPPDPSPVHVAAREGRTIQIGGFGIIYKIHSGDSGDSVSVVEHTLAPGLLAAPMHRHGNEDELSYVLEGEITIQQGEVITTAGPGSYVLKPRGIFHTFWNAGATTARLIEVITPGGFERYFAELEPLISSAGPPDMGAIVALAARYGLEFDLGSVPRLVQQHGVRLG